MQKDRFTINNTRPKIAVVTHLSFPVCIPPNDIVAALVVGKALVCDGKDDKHAMFFFLSCRARNNTRVHPSLFTQKMKNYYCS